ncbi:MAG: NAD(P)-binding domain-containing protein, partial [Bacteroidota bacterium]
YLTGISGHYALPVETGVEVQSVHATNDSFAIKTNDGEYRSTYVIWAAGEYQYPDLNTFTGAELCLHYSEIESFAELEGEDRIVIGAYESGFDATVNLVSEGKNIILLDNSDYLELVKSDSSYSLSPFTRERIETVIDQFDYFTETRVTSVEFEDGIYLVKTADGQTFTSTQRPINCTGFSTSLNLVQSLFHFEDGYPLLNRVDESTEAENLFLVGPQVKHDTALFCFIYKYRQRFAVVAESIAQREGIHRLLIQDTLQEYKDNNFYLTDLSCCDDECVC